MNRSIVWFRKDLRLHDNVVLKSAIESSDEVVYFYCFEVTEFERTPYGFPKTDSARAQFLIESVADLRENLRAKGAELIVRLGDTAQQLAEVIKQTKAKRIYASKEIHQEEILIQEKVEATCGIPVNYFFTTTLFHVNDLPHAYEDTPRVFTQFRKGVEKKSKVRELYPTPNKLKPNNLELLTGQIPTLAQFGLDDFEIDQRAAINPMGGETEGLKRLQEYIYTDDALIHYKESRNGLIGKNYSSKLSLWLWNGCLSPRKVYWEVQKFEREVKKNQSTYWLIFELIWRDFFKFISLQHGNRIFNLNGIKGDKEIEWSRNEVLFQKWASGETGVPFIDANMRELNGTGFMSNRGRQNVASFLVNDLGIDWRMGAAYFESKLIDYDVASNYGNWMYIAGVGNDPRDRYFNVISQAKRYDPKGKYVKHWLPELESFSEHEVHHPWTNNHSLFKQSDYPRPIVEPAYWRKYY